VYRLFCVVPVALPQVGLWKRCMLVMLEIMDTLGANENIVLDDTAEPSEERTAGNTCQQAGNIHVKF
jgi:hypothetical protein